MSAILVQFAGDDQRPKQKPPALTLFRLGYDTREIAERLSISEAAASRQVHEQRSKELGLAVEYERGRRR